MKTKDWKVILLIFLPVMGLIIFSIVAGWRLSQNNGVLINGQQNIPKINTEADNTKSTTNQNNTSTDGGKNTNVAQKQYKDDSTLINGRVSKFDQNIVYIEDEMTNRKNSITLNDQTIIQKLDPLTLQSVQADNTDLRKGVQISVVFDDKQQQKVAQAINITPPIYFSGVVLKINDQKLSVRSGNGGQYEVSLKSDGRVVKYDADGKSIEVKFGDILLGDELLVVADYQTDYSLTTFSATTIQMLSTGQNEDLVRQLNEVVLPPQPVDTANQGGDQPPAEMLKNLQPLPDETKEVEPIKL